MQTLTRLFEILHGGLIVAVSDSASGTVRLIVENRPALAPIRDSWGRVAVTLTGCRTFGFVSGDGVGVSDANRRASTLRPVVREAHSRAGMCRVECGFGLSACTLEIEADTFSLMLGGGRVVSFGELQSELGAPVSAQYAQAS